MSQRAESIGEGIRPREHRCMAQPDPPVTVPVTVPVRWGSNEGWMFPISPHLPNLRLHVSPQASYIYIHLFEINVHMYVLQTKGAHWYAINNGKKKDIPENSRSPTTCGCIARYPRVSCVCIYVCGCMCACVRRCSCTAVSVAWNSVLSYMQGILHYHMVEAMPYTVAEDVLHLTGRWVRCFCNWERDGVVLPTCLSKKKQ